MKKFILLLLVLVITAVPVAAEGYFVVDDSGLMQDHDVQKLEEIYSAYPASQGFTVALVTADSFGGLSAESFAGEFYDVQGYLEDGILLLVSLEEGEWYILTNGACADRIPNRDAERIGQELAPLIRDGQYYAAFLKFPELAAEVFAANAPAEDDWAGAPDAAPAVHKKNYGKTVAISMGVGMLIGLIAVGIMAALMKSVRRKDSASDYMRPGSLQLHTSRDIFLYSHVTRTARPKSNSSGSGGSGRGGAGGKL